MAKQQRDKSRSSKTVKDNSSVGSNRGEPETKKSGHSRRSKNEHHHQADFQSQTVSAVFAPTAPTPSPASGSSSTSTTNPHSPHHKKRNASTLSHPNGSSAPGSSNASVQSVLSRVPTGSTPISTLAKASVIGGQKVIIPPLWITAHKITNMKRTSARPLYKSSHRTPLPGHKSSHKTHSKRLTPSSPVMASNRATAISATPVVANTTTFEQAPTSTTTTSTSSSTMSQSVSQQSIVPASSTSTVNSTSETPGDASGTQQHEQQSNNDDYRLLLSPMFAAMTKITDNLFLTGVGGMTRENFTRNHIDFVVNITTDAPFWEDVESLRIALEDEASTNMLPYLDFAVDKIHEVITQRGAHVLVHCLAGVSRSATVVIAYLMKYRQMDLRSAFNHCYNLRPVIRPNNGFMMQLMNYELQLYGRSSAQMVQANIEGTSITIPNFFLNEHHRLVTLEVMRVREQQRQSQTPTPMSTPSPTR